MFMFKSNKNKMQHGYKADIFPDKHGGRAGL